MQSAARNVEAYLNDLPLEKREAIGKVRNVILTHLPDGSVEVMNWGMITYEIPLAIFPNTYNKQPLMYAALASQKHYMSIYICGVYSDKNQLKKLKKAFSNIGVKPNMGKSCIRFTKLEKIPLETIGELIAEYSVEEYIKHYNRCRK